MLLLNHLHCSHFLICTPITSSHALLLNHHKHCYYFITSYFSTCTALTSSHALLLLPHIHCSYFTTCTATTSPQAMLVLHHMHYYYSNTRTALTSSQALLFHHVQFYHCLTCTAPPAGIELTITDLGFSSTQKEKEKRHVRPWNTPPLVSIQSWK